MINIKTVNIFTLFFHTKSKKCDMYFTLTAYLSLQEAHFECSIATCS